MKLWVHENVKSYDYALDAAQRIKGNLCAISSFSGLRA